MKHLTKTKNALLIILMFMSASVFGYSIEYTSIASGDWNDPAIWSTDGGLTPCGCAPSMNITDTYVHVEEYTYVTASNHLTINTGSYLHVDYNSSFLAPNSKLVARNSVLDFFSTAEFSSVTVGTTNGSNAAIINIYANFLLQAGMAVHAGSVNVLGGYILSYGGNLVINQNGTINLTYGGKLDFQIGNLTNNGLLHIGPGSCAGAAGQWQNEATGSVTGSGSAMTYSGNISNDNVFSVDITWCSPGQDSGMPSNENCADANMNCTAIILPVELVLFEGKNAGRINELTWTTASELNSSHFELLKSEDGLKWTSIAQLSAAGNSTSSNDYYATDENLQQATNYYRLRQVDLDGKIELSDIVSVSGIASDEIIVFPNPVQSGSLLNISGVFQKEDVAIYNAFGARIDIGFGSTLSNGVLTIDTKEVPKGVYFIRITMEGDNNPVARRFVVQ